MFQGFLSNDIHMVGRFVQNQEIGSGLKQFAQGKANLFTAGKLPKCFVHFFLREQEAAQGTACLFTKQLRIRVPEVFQYGLIQIRIALDSLLLVKISPFHIVAERIGSAKRGQHTHQSFQQSGLAFAIFSQNSKPFSFTQSERDTGKLFFVTNA